MADSKEVRRLGRLIEPFRVKPGSKVRLPGDFDPGFKGDFIRKKDARGRLAEGVAQLSMYQDRLAAQDEYAVLIVLQAPDAAGKDGTIKHVMSGVNPQGVAVTSFKVPSARELNHDYLWRYARQMPSRGRIGIFNRSYYEEVLVVRVHPVNLERQHLPHSALKGDVWARRFREINDWERYLVDNGIRIVKLFLNLSWDEQRDRFLARLDTPAQNWKFSSADARERERWDEYQKAYSEMLSHTSTDWAPWHVIPADRKWFARLAAGGVILHEVMRIDPQYPTVGEDHMALLEEARTKLMAEIPGRNGTGGGTSRRRREGEPEAPRAAAT